MRSKIFNFGITFFVEAVKAASLQQLADSRKVSLSQIIRDAIDAYLKQSTPEGGLIDEK